MSRENCQTSLETDAKALNSEKKMMMTGKRVRMMLAGFEFVAW